ncbi:uncharacterized protein LTR77_000776 [Saxophila tyrrhenica]|uniref:Uncharacterized protein n=1 Tax=Saxophila tyrrhenica TaxID=1690608 RepID=A0AAV9PPA7_9PEZI|nr:hypothetical protein LTR77_000776 [Saxophila tyrrhenica]
MNSFRRATPDSEAVASSEDERPWPTAKSFGSLPRKENSVPGLGGTIWSTQKRDSFKMEKAAQRNAAREARLAAPGGARGILRAEGTPSPAASDASGVLPFPIPMQPVPKAGRSMSHSQGQREVPTSTNDHTVLPLGLLAEEDADTESESDMGGGLTHTTSHPPIGTLHRTSTLPMAYESYYGGSNGRDAGHAVGGAPRIEAAFANLSLDHPPRRAQWQSKLGWDDVPNVNESRRHSLADIPTRRGSVAGTDSRPQLGGAAYWPDRMYEWNGGAVEAEAEGYADCKSFDSMSHISKCGLLALHAGVEENAWSGAPGFLEWDYLD